MPTRADWLAYQATLTKPHQDALRFHYGAQAEVGRRAETVVNHEGWQTYLDHLTSLRDTVIKKREATLTKMAEGTELGEALAKLKLECAALGGELRALDAVLTMIPTMIQNGKDATEKLNDLRASSAGTPPADDAEQGRDVVTT